jgi:hypothetical protein
MRRPSAECENDRTLSHEPSGARIRGLRPSSGARRVTEVVLAHGRTPRTPRSAALPWHARGAHARRAAKRLLKGLRACAALSAADSADSLRPGPVSRRPHENSILQALNESMNLPGVAGSPGPRSSHFLSGQLYSGRTNINTDIAWHGPFRTTIPIVSRRGTKFAIQRPDTVGTVWVLHLGCREHGRIVLGPEAARRRLIILALENLEEAAGLRGHGGIEIGEVIGGEEGRGGEGLPGPDLELEVLRPRGKEGVKPGGGGGDVLTRHSR